MTVSDRWLRIETLFHRLRALPPGERRRRLQEETPDEPSIARQVLQLVAASDGTGATLDELREQAVELVSGAAEGALDPGRRIGEFTIVEPLASGGMGTVYVARQEQPARRVALKVLTRGLASERRARRFEVEAELLARLRHPSIAHVYSSGVLDARTGSVPWFALELVEGALPLTEYAREHRLGERARLELFVTLCDGVQHGHERGVVHRDLKPGNMLVDETGRARLIDFGVAKALEAESEGEAELVIGTPAYMSPEQAAGDSDAVDTRSDVWSLGIVLHELLSGERPAEGRISPRMPRPLAAILRKATAERGEQRYPGAAALAGDLRLYLARRPVQALPPSLGYGLRCLVQRSPALVATALLALLSLTIGLGVASWGLFEARVGRREAETNLADTLASIESLGAILRQASPFESGPKTPLHEAVEGVLQQLDGRVTATSSRAYAKAGPIAVTPLVEAELRHYVGQVFVDLGRLDEGQHQLARALELKEALFGAASREACETRAPLVNALIRLRRLQEMGDLAERHHEYTLAAYGPGSPEELNAESLIARATAAYGHHVEACELYRAHYERCRENLGEHEDTYTALFNYALSLKELDRHAESVPLLEEVVVWRESELGETHLSTLSAIGSLAAILNDLERPEEALEYFEFAYQAYAEVLERDNYASASLKSNYGACLRRTGDARAIEVLEEALAARRSIYDEHDLNTRLTSTNLAAALLHAGLSRERAGDAEGRPLWERGERILADLVANEEYERPGPDEPHLHHENCVTVRSNLGFLLMHTGRYDEAVAHFSDALELVDDAGRLVSPKTSQHNRVVRAHRAHALAELGRLDEARAILAELTEEVADIPGAGVARLVQLYVGQLPGQ